MVTSSIVHGFIIARDPLRFYSSDHEILNTGSQLLMSEKYLDKKFHNVHLFIIVITFIKVSVLYHIS